MKEIRKQLKSNPEYDYLEAAASQDCTGLMPTLPKSGEEIENYGDVYPFLPALSEELSQK